MNRTPSLFRAAVVAAAILLPASTALAATPSVGVPQEIRSGLFTDVNLGGFFTLGGKDSSGNSGASNAQAYLQLGLGYDLTRNFALAASFGLGASAASCFGNDFTRCYGAASTSGSTATTKNGPVPLPDNFTATMFMLEASYKHFFTERFTLQPRLHLGYAMLEPAPNDAGKTGFVVGAGAGIEYATHMDHFSIGADIYGRYITGPNIFGMAIYPKVKYTF